MLAKNFPILCLLLLLAACQTAPSKQTIELEVARLDAKLDTLESALITQFDTVCSNNLEQLEADISNRVGGALRRQLTEARKETQAATRKIKELEAQCENDVLDEKIYLGEVEDVTFYNEEVTLEARIDTGAETSSVGVYALTQFERDGDEWVRFKLLNLKKAPWVEYKIRDDVRIKTKIEGFTDERYEIRMDIKVGNIIYRRQLVNLADRKKFDYQALLGRSFLRDRAVVDVSVKHQLKRRK